MYFRMCYNCNNVELCENWCLLSPLSDLCIAKTAELTDFLLIKVPFLLHKLVHTGPNLTFLLWLLFILPVCNMVTIVLQKCLTTQELWPLLNVYWKLTNHILLCRTRLWPWKQLHGVHISTWNRIVLQTHKLYTEVYCTRLC